MRNIGNTPDGSFIVEMTRAEVTAFERVPVEPVPRSRQVFLDCQCTDCEFNRPGGKCAKVAPQISLSNENVSVSVKCWSHTDRKPTPLSCPLCGGGADVHTSFSGCVVRCIRCAVTTPLYPTEADAVKAWNRRTP
jgi:hypothetical protein